MKPNYTLTNGEEMNRQHPDTFEIPTLRERKSLKPGKYVKLIFEEKDKPSERMWVKVEYISDNGRYIGTLANDPIIVSSIRNEDEVIYLFKGLDDKT